MAYLTEQEFDGDGQRAKSVLRRYDEATDQWVIEKETYYVSSSVLGAPVSELSSTGAKEKTFVHANGSVLAIQSILGGTQYLEWKHYDPSGASYRGTGVDGAWAAAAEMEPMGANAGYFKPITWPQSTSMGKVVPYGGIPDLLSPTGGCQMDGVPTPCELVTMENSVQCPNNQCSRYNAKLNNGRGGFDYFHATQEGNGYLPADAIYQGNGHYNSPSSGSVAAGELSGIIKVEFSHASSLPQNPGQQAKYGNLEKCQRTYLPEQYPEGKPQPTDLAIGLALDGGLNDTGDSAMILALWAKESSFDPRPRNDHGPMQLTSWWSNYSNRNNLNLIVPGAYDSFGRPAGSPNRDRPFQGKISANVMTAGNIIRHSRTALGQSYYQIGYGYGPGPDKATRNDYATHAARLQSRYANFINCLKTGQ